MTDKPTLGDAPIQQEYRDKMNAIARALDETFNGEARGKDRKVGFVLLVFSVRRPVRRPLQLHLERRGSQRHRHDDEGADQAVRRPARRDGDGMMFRVRYTIGKSSPHVYCRIFVADHADTTFAMVGSLMMRQQPDFEAFRQSFSAEFIEEDPEDA
jgi:hypothetical protein